MGDGNFSGVRDDVGAVIDSSYTAGAQSATALKAAKATQQSVLSDYSDPAAVREVKRELSPTSMLLKGERCESRASVPAA